jgi:hypothetical protein
VRLQLGFRHCSEAKIFCSKCFYQGGAESYDWEVWFLCKLCANVLHTIDFEQKDTERKVGAIVATLQNVLGLMYIECFHWKRVSANEAEVMWGEKNGDFKYQI